MKHCHWGFAQGSPSLPSGFLLATSCDTSVCSASFWSHLFFPTFNCPFSYSVLYVFPHKLNIFPYVWLFSLYSFENFLIFYQDAYLHFPLFFSYTSPAPMSSHSEGSWYKTHVENTIFSPRVSSRKEVAVLIKMINLFPLWSKQAKNNNIHAYKIMKNQLNLCVF